MVMVVVFTFIPLHYRVLATNFVGLFWNMYLSYMSNSNVSKQYGKVLEFADESTFVA